MTIRDALRLSNLEPLDAEVLMAHTLGASRSWIMAHDEGQLRGKQQTEFLGMVQRRTSGEPIAHITGMKEFYSRPFRVTPLVLIPRPSTEILVEEVLRFLKEPLGGILEADTGISILSVRFSSDQPVQVLDIGTGSGIIAITLRKEGWRGQITAIDLSPEALDIARENAEQHGLVDEIRFVEGDGAKLITEMKEPFLVVSNPPYIPEDTMLETDVVDHEPHLALFAGKSGTDVIIPLVKAARANPMCTGIVLELRTEQAGVVTELLA